MPLESGTYISDLDASNPVGSSDLVSSVDDHLRWIKAAILATFPNIDGEVTASDEQISALNGGTLAAANGSNLTSLNASNIASGTLADGRLSNNVPLLNASNTFTAQSAIVGSHASDTRVLRSNTSGSLVLAGGNSNSGSAGGRVLLRGIDTNNGEILVLAGNSGNVQIDGVTIDINGAADISGTLTMGGAVLLPQGSASAPAVARANDPDTGLYFPSGNTVGLSAGNSLVASFSQSEIDLTATTLDFNGNADISGTLNVGGAVLAPLTTRTTSATIAPGSVHARSANTTIPQAAAGNWVAVYNNSSSAITLTQGSGLTLRLGGTSTTGSRTLAARGMAVIWWNSATEAVCVGQGVS